MIVTGAAGFIGSRVAGALLARGATVLSLDSLDPFYDPAIKQRNLDALHASAPQGRMAHRGVDIRDARALHDAFGSFRPTGVVHLAARAGVRPSIADPAGYALTNVVGTQMVLDACERAGCPRVVCASSSSVYGDRTAVPFAEADPADHPASPYAATKRACELIGHAHHHRTGAAVAMLRFFTVFGPGQRPDLAISRFLTGVARAEPITVFGDGSSSRDYTFIDDITAGVLSAYERIETHGYRVWNLGCDHPTTLAELITVVARVVGRNPVVDRRPVQPGDVSRTWADLTRARAELDYNPKVGLREGVERQFSWMRVESGV